MAGVEPGPLVIGCATRTAQSHSCFCRSTKSTTVGKSAAIFNRRVASCTKGSQAVRTNFLNSLATNWLPKIGQIFYKLFGLFWKHHILEKKLPVAAFWATFGKYCATFYSNICSRWSQASLSQKFSLSYWMITITRPEMPIQE